MIFDLRIVRAGYYNPWRPMAAPLPDFRASLSKYYRAEAHFPLIASIEHDTPESIFRRGIDENLYATGKQRYLLVENGIVLRDRLVDFIHDEGNFTERVKMVMYFLFMFRDSRYRDFICNEVGRNNGRWDTSVFSKPRMNYFTNAGGHKAFTNLRQFLFQTDILDEHTFNVRMPALAGWFPWAVQIAAQSIPSAEARQSFLASPHGFLIKHKINALLNATPEELASLEFGGTYEESSDLLPAIELPPGITQPDTNDFHQWNRTAPTRSSGQSTGVQTDPAALERANGQHFLLEQHINSLCLANNVVANTNKHIDLVADFGQTSVIFEMKSCTPAAIRSQVRRALSQLFEYRYLYRTKLKQTVLLCMVLEREPRGTTSWLVPYVESLNVGMIWKNDRDQRFNCTPATKTLLRQWLPQLGQPDF